ncbi:MAG TPA: helix-turn-helix domain-containing protein [Puia sp.]|nr:helix-turn-helix domain-containing protein [Puia sp.]
MSILPPAAQFRVASINEAKCVLNSFNRRDFFKISLIKEGNSQLLYANRGYKIQGPALVFTNPSVPFSWESTDNIGDPAGVFCIFTNSFILAAGGRRTLQESALFKADGNPVFILNATQVAYIEGLFTKMRQELEGDYKYKFDVIGSLITLLIHEALKMQPAEAFTTPANASARIAKLFLALLEKQFPVDLSDNHLQLKKAGDFARLLNVHANHLNAALQEITGRSTTAHINERILFEAKSLIMHTDWSIAEIAFSLGFEYVSYFNRFFKKHTNLTPVLLRKDN